MIIEKKFMIKGMSCAACSAAIQKGVAKLAGVDDVQVSLLSNSMTVRYDDEATDVSAIAETVRMLGYGIDNSENKAKADDESVFLHNAQELKRRFIVSIIFLVPLVYIAMGGMWGAPVPECLDMHRHMAVNVFTQLILTVPVIFLNRSYFINGGKALWHLTPNMDTLVAMGAAAGLIYGIANFYRLIYLAGSEEVGGFYFEAAAMILTLITLGKYLEAKSKGRTGDAIKRLLNLTPDTAVIEYNGEEKKVPANSLKTGDVVVVRAGNSIPVDGTVIYGSGVVDEAAITGESMPVDKNCGDKVTGGTVNLNGFFKMQAEKVGQDTTLAKMIALVEAAGNSRAPIARVADKVSGVFVPLVMGIAVITFIGWLIAGYPLDFAISCAVAVLVVSCPCALGLATPVAIMVGTGKGAELGVLFKSAEALERMAGMKNLILDKTGTVTEGKPAVVDIAVCNGFTENELLKLAAAIEKLSSHPIAEAIVNYTTQQKIVIPEARNYKATPGNGVEANVDGLRICGGNQKLMRNLNVDITDLHNKAEEFACKGGTPVFFSADNKLAGIIAVADKIKKSSFSAVERLLKSGVNIAMITGDNLVTATNVAGQLGITSVIAGVMPEDKAKEVAVLQKSGITAMAGDGINDAPALARADIGIAIGSGTDVAIESADIVLMRDDLNGIADAFELSRAVMRNIKENLFWAFFYNTMGIPLAAGLFYLTLGWKLNPVFSAAAMSMSSFCVVSNALRLLRFKNCSPQNNDRNSTAKPAKHHWLLQVYGMSCMHCQKKVEDALKSVPGAENVKVDIVHDSAELVTPENVSAQVITGVIEAAGYKAEIK